MKQRLKVFAMLWAALLLLMMAAHAVWMAVEPGYAWSDMSQAPAVIWHGLSMDLSMSAYFVAPVLLTLIASIWYVRAWLRRAVEVYLWIVAALFAVGYVIDAVLYPYWGFRLDITPWFYFAALLGMCTKFAEVTLAVHFRERNKDGDYVGGPMYYIQNGLGRKWRWLAYAYALLGALACFGIGNTTQINTITVAVGSVLTSFNLASEATLPVFRWVGSCFAEALGNCAGIYRTGSFLYPMDEALLRAAVDFGGRPFLVCNAELTGIPLVSLNSNGVEASFQTDCFEDFWQAFVNSAQCNLHLDTLRGRSDHHKMEGLFKAAARAIRAAVEIDPRRNGAIPSTKGTIGS